MRSLLLCILCLVPLFLIAQQLEGNKKSFLEEGIKAPNIHHIGDAWLNFLIEADSSFNKNITQATFSANSTLDWHKHSTAQIIMVLDGKGYYQERGHDPILIEKGDVIKCEKDTEHWHTSSKNSAVSYIAIYGPEPTIWTEKLTQEYYDEIAKILERKE